MNPKFLNTELLKPFLPKNSHQKIAPLIDGTFILNIVPPRKTKMGDFKASLNRNSIPVITVNGDLNPYSFLITLLHEIAHYKVWKKYSDKVLPHGVEWKNEFKKITRPFIHSFIFPEDVIKALSNYMMNPKASSCSDKDLYRVLLSYDKDAASKILLETLPKNTLFTIDNRKIFIKGAKRRTRYLCEEVNSKKQYVVHGSAIVKIVDK